MTFAFDADIFLQEAIDPAFAAFRDAAERQRQFGVEPDFAEILRKHLGAEFVKEPPPPPPRRPVKWPSTVPRLVYHDVLGIEPGASTDEINRAFREKAKTEHPDAGGSNARMALLNRARERALQDVTS